MMHRYVAALALALVGSVSLAQTKELKVGVIYDLTGPLAAGGSYAGYLGKGFEQLGLHTGGVVLYVLLRPLGAGLHGPALNNAAPRFGRLARQPCNAVVGAACCVPLRPQGG